MALSLLLVSGTVNLIVGVLGYLQRDARNARHSGESIYPLAYRKLVPFPHRSGCLRALETKVGRWRARNVCDVSSGKKMADFAVLQQKYVPAEQIVKDFEPFGAEFVGS